MADEDLGTGSITIEFDDSAATTGLDRLADRIERALNRAARDGARRMERQLNQAIRRITPLRTYVELDVSEARAEIDALSTYAAGVTANIVPEVDRDDFVTRVQTAIAGLEVSITVIPDMSGFNREVEAHPTPTVEVEVNADTDRFRRSMASLGKLAGRFAGLAKTVLTIGAIGIAASSAAVAVGGLIAALAPLVGILAALPALFIGVKVATGALKLALDGVGDAFGAALTEDAEAFEKSLEGLSPRARDAAREVRALKPAFEDLKTSVQDMFFKQIEGEITATAKALSGPLQTGLTSIAGRWGQAARNAIQYVRGASGVSNVQSILKATDQTMEGFSRTTNRVTAGVLKIAASISDAYGGELAGGLAEAGQNFGDFLQRSAESGAAVAWVDKALNNFARLGDVLGNIGSAFSGIFAAGRSDGEGFLATLQDITGRFDEFVNSARGQEAIGNLFSALATIGAQLAPILQEIVVIVGAIAPALEPLLTAIGPAILGVVQALGPLIDGVMPGLTAVVEGVVAALDTITSSGALEGLGAEIGNILQALSPLLPVFGELIAAIGVALVPVLNALAIVLTPIIDVFTSLVSTVLPPLTEAFLTIMTAITPFITALGLVLRPIIEALVPLFLAVATAVADLAVQLTPLIQQVADAVIPLFLALAPAIEQIVTALVPLIGQIVDALIPALPPLIEAFTGILDALLPIIPVIADLVTELAPLVGWIITALTPVLQFAANLIKWVSLEVVVPVIEGIIDVIRGIVTATGDVIDGVRYFVTTVTGFFSSLYTTVTSSVSNFISDVVGFFRALPGRTVAALSRFGSDLVGVFNRAKTQLAVATVRLVTDTVNEVKKLPGRTVAALGNVGTLLVGVGRDMIQGLINGIKSLGGAVGGVIKDLASSAVDSAKDFLGISSPSKVFRQIGVFVGQGLVQGLRSSEDSVKRTSDRLVALIRDAFSGKAGQRTTLDDRLVNLVRTNQRELESLARQREALIKRIADANQFARDTAESAAGAFGLDTLFDRVNKEVDDLKKRALAPGLLPDRFPVVDLLTDQLDASAARIRRFNQQVNDLAKRGLSRTLISQLIDLGPQAGADLAQQLSGATSAQIRELNAAQAELDKAANQFGRNSADKLFDAGKQAGEGFLAGLKGQQKAIEDLMVSIAKSMATAIRRALGIKSPSRVFRQIGVFVGEGLATGITALAPAVSRSAGTLATAAVAGFGPSPRLTAITDPFGTSAVPGGLGALNAAQRGSQGLSARTSGGPLGTGAPVTIEKGAIVINEVSNGETTAVRVMNRLVGAGFPL